MVDLRGSKWAPRPSSHFVVSNNNDDNDNTNNNNQHNTILQNGNLQNQSPHYFSNSGFISSNSGNDQFRTGDVGTNALLSSSASTTATTTKGVSLSKPVRDLIQRRSSLQKFIRLNRRLRWKSRGLLYSHHRARDPVEKVQNIVGGVSFPMDVNVDVDANTSSSGEGGGGGGGEAEMMFKVDFFEFYVLLERVLVLLLGVCGSVIVGVGGGGGGSVGDRDSDNLRFSSSLRTRDMNSRVKNDKADGRTEPQSFREQLVEEARQRQQQQQHHHHHHQQQQQRQNQTQTRSGGVGDSMMFHGYAHRFHANVLAALDQPSHPLHDTLGNGNVRTYLGIAKEFRNRWKDAEEKPADRTEDGLVGSRYEKTVHDLKLEDMLCTILRAVDAANVVAEEELKRFASSIETEGDQIGGETDAAAATMAMMMELDEEDFNRNAPWEAMPDAMDWD